SLRVRPTGASLDSETDACPVTKSWQPCRQPAWPRAPKIQTTPVRYVSRMAPSLCFRPVRPANAVRLAEAHGPSDFGEFTKNIGRCRARNYRFSGCEGEMD